MRNINVLHYYYFFPQLFVDLTTLLSGHQDLVDDFAGLVLCFQAVLCGSLVDPELTTIREFMEVS